MTPDEIIARIDAVFTADYPGDAFLQNAFSGFAPAEDVGAFVGATDWRTLDADFLDAHYTALSFFSETGLRFFLPAYMTADLRDELMTADPAFGLIHGFSELSVDLPDDGVSHRSGGPVLLGPQRYGAITWEDAFRHRMSVFCREEAAVIRDYLVWRMDRDTTDLERPRIEIAIERFWQARSETAPQRAELDAFRFPGA